MSQRRQNTAVTALRLRIEAQRERIEAQDVVLKERAELLAAQARQIEKYMAEATAHARKCTELTKSADYYRGEMLRIDKERRDAVENHGLIFRSLLRMSLEVHESVVAARFEGTEAAFIASLGKTRELVRNVLTRELFDLAYPPAGWKSTMEVILSSAGAVVGMYYMLVQKAPPPPPAAPKVAPATNEAPAPVAPAPNASPTTPVAGEAAAQADETKTP